MTRAEAKAHNQAAKYKITMRKGTIFRQDYAAQTSNIARANVECNSGYKLAFIVEMQRQAARDYANARNWMGLDD
jgi:hypothetical protein